MDNNVMVPQMCWEGVCDLELPFPRQWQVEVANMAGYNQQALSAEEIKQRISSPIAGPPLHELARGKKQVAIIFDDMTRATRTWQILPTVLAELAGAGIPDGSIRFIAATGTHGAMNRFDFVRKLGEDTLRRFPVYNHNAFGNHVSLGKTSYGTEILANAEVMACDLKIAIGSVVPHIAAGFGGGAKIILPGICAFQTIEAFHHFARQFHQEHPEHRAGMGTTGKNGLRMNMEEAVKMVGLDMIIDTLFNFYGETTAVYAGEPEAAFSAAVEQAKTHYLTAQPGDKDIVICNAFAKVSEAEGALNIGFGSVKASGGSMMLICHAESGHVIHYLFGSFGNTPRKNQIAHRLPANVRNLIIFNRYPDMTTLNHFGDREKVRIMTEWDDILAFLRAEHPGNPEVAVYPNGDVQYALRS
jgi:nickel-dependent lactate racemase